MRGASGRWVVYRDEESGDLYYHNSESGETMNDLPAGSGITWVRTRDSDGDEYYFNATTGESVLDEPKGFNGVIAQ